MLRSAAAQREKDIFHENQGRTKMATRRLMTVKAHLAACLGVSLAIITVAGTGAYAGHVPASKGMEAVHGAQLVIPMMNPERGKRLFVDKGCVACHSINGVG